MKTTPISLKPSDESDGIYFVYFWVGVVTEPGEGWEPVPPRVGIVWDLKRTADLAANVHITALKDISPEGTVKIEVLPAGTRRDEAEKWIGTPAGKAWSEGVVGGSLCAVALAIAK
jgi:hypothetical protein